VPNNTPLRFDLLKTSGASMILCGICATLRPKSLRRRRQATSSMKRCDSAKPSQALITTQGGQAPNGVLWFTALDFR
jgi:predicted phage tail protein